MDSEYSRQAQLQKAHAAPMRSNIATDPWLKTMWENIAASYIDMARKRFNQGGCWGSRYPAMNA